MPDRLTRLARLGCLLALVGAAHATINVLMLRRPRLGDRPRARDSVLVPARDEAAAIQPCVRALVSQVIELDAELLVLDDGSRDGTAALARAVGDQVRVLEGRPPPPGWLGKPNACRQLATSARGDALVFVDADVIVAPRGVAAAVALLERLDVDLLSAHPREVAVTLTERLVQPLLQWSVLTFLPLRLAERSPRPSLVAANGQFLVVRRRAYERCGGHVPDAVLDDLALARAIKRTGGRVAWVDGSRLARCRMYAGWPEVREGYGKSLWTAFGGPAGALAATALMTLAGVAPAAAMLRGSRAGALGYLAGVAGRAVSARATGARVADAFAHPVSVLLFDWLTYRSLVQHRRGALRWRDRPVSVDGAGRGAAGRPRSRS